MQVPYGVLKFTNHCFSPLIQMDQAIFTYKKKKSEVWLID